MAEYQRRNVAWLRLLSSNSAFVTLGFRAYVKTMSVSVERNRIGYACVCVCVCVCVMLLARSRYDKDLPFSRHAIRLRAFSSRPGFLLRGLSTLSLRVHIDAGICRWNVERCSFSVLYGRTMSVCHSDCVYRVCCRLPCTRPTVCRRVPSGGGSRRRRAVI